MATWLGHGIGGLAVAKAAGYGRRGMALAFLLANAPDLDLVLGLALEGDSDAFHRDWWSHSPAAALFAAALAFTAYAAFQALRRKRIDRRRGGSYALFIGAVVLSHSLFDFVLINPTILVPEAEVAELDDLPLAVARELLAFSTDALFYGGFSLLFYRLYLRFRRRSQQRAA